MEYISVKQASALWKIDPSNIGKLCRKGKIEGAKIVGRNWLIPKNTPKPIDGRTKQAKENQTEAFFRFPLFINTPEGCFNPPLSEEERRLRKAQALFYSGEFQRAQILFEELSKNAESIYIRICASFFMCVLSAVYDMTINWDKYYCGMNLLLSKDFPCKKEMELFLPLLDFMIGRFGKIPEKLNTDPKYEYHTSAWYMNAFLSVFNFDERNGETSNLKCTEPFATLCRLMERDGYYAEAQELHIIIFIYHYSAHNEEAMLYHLRKGIALAYEHNFLFPIADAEIYYADALNRVLCEYPQDFAEKIHKCSKKIYINFSRFALKNANTNVYERLSKSDYRYVFYAIEGFTNKQIAGFCNVSERTVANKYNDIYEKLSVKSKQELVEKMSLAFGKQ